MGDPILDQSACSLVDRMRRGELSAVGTMRAFLDRIAALDPKLNAFAYLDRDIALAAAERVDQARASGVAPGPLHGLPVAVKDIIDTGDMPTEFGWLRADLIERVSDYDAVLTFAASGPAPLASEGTGDPIFATLWTLIGAPAYSLPLMTGAKGLPVGVQAVAAPGRDWELTRAAAWLMRADAQ
jgi:Asp-tRNA(Asn)/Glu-tRNA(Gln) amidotransferase A subunit family amidase